MSLPRGNIALTDRVWKFRISDQEPHLPWGNELTAHIYNLRQWRFDVNQLHRLIIQEIENSKIAVTGSLTSTPIEVFDHTVM